MPYLRKLWLAAPNPPVSFADSPERLRSNLFGKGGLNKVSQARSREYCFPADAYTCAKGGMYMITVYNVCKEDGEEFLRLLAACGTDGERA